MPVLGIGTDIVRTARFAEILKRNPHRMHRLQQRIMHPTERLGKNAAQSLSSSWAAKEALYKSLHPREQQACRFNQWRKVAGPDGYEMVCDAPRSDRIMISISHDGDYTVAYALRQTLD